MPADSPALLPRLAHAAVTGVKLLAVGLVALLMAIVATVSQIFNERKEEA